MSEPTIWWMIVVMSLLTFLLRSGFLLAGGRLRLHPVLERSLDFVPASVLAAIVAPAFFQPTGNLDISWNNFHLLAGIVAAVTAYFTRSTLFTLIAGMAALWCLQGFLGG